MYMSLLHFYRVVFQRYILICIGEDRLLLIESWNSITTVAYNVCLNIYFKDKISIQSGGSETGGRHDSIISSV